MSEGVWGLFLAPAVILDYKAVFYLLPSISGLRVSVCPLALHNQAVQSHLLAHRPGHLRHSLQFLLAVELPEEDGVFLSSFLLAA